MRVNNFDIKQKKGMEYLFCYMPPTQTRSGKINVNKTQQISVTTQVCFFCKNRATTYSTTTPSKSFYITFVDIFSEIIKP